MNWAEILIAIIFLPIAFFLSLMIPLGIIEFVRRKKGEKFADHPVLIFGIVLIMYLIGALTEVI